MVSSSTRLCAYRMRPLSARALATWAGAQAEGSTRGVLVVLMRALSAFADGCSRIRPGLSVGVRADNGVRQGGGHAESLG